jgi:PAS domain S-box-containing protein
MTDRHSATDDDAHATEVEALRRRIAELESACAGLAQVQAAVSESEERYRRLVELSPDLIGIAVAGRIAFLNAAGARMIGVEKPEDVYGRRILSFVHPRYRREAHETIMLIMQTDQPMPLTEETWLRIDGTPIAIEVTAIRTTYRNEAAVQIVAHDVSDRLRVEQELRDAKSASEAAAEAARSANRAKSAFLANMSHEIRTPMNAILGFAQLMARDPSLAPRQQENLALIRRSGEHLLTLINDILSMSKIEAGRLSLQEAPFDLLRLLRSLEEMFLDRARGKGLALRVAVSREVPSCVAGDEGKLRQVLINLIGNGLKFTARGSVTLRVDLAAADADGAVRLHFAVEDTGVGIAPAELPGLFEPFSQTESGRKTLEGTGLGLAISRQFVRLMGGDITVGSELGRGSCFEFELPMRTVEAAGEPLPAGAASRPARLVPGQPLRRILVVDDDALNRRVLMSLLGSINPPVASSGPAIELRAVEDGKQAVDAWEEWLPHLVFMDIRMPVLDGRRATRMIKSRLAARRQAGHDLPDTVVVALTASAFEEERAGIVAVGCDDFVRKPFRMEQVCDVLQRHLGMRFEEMPAEQAPGVQRPAPPGGAESRMFGETETDLDLLRAGLWRCSPDLVAELRRAADLGDLSRVAAIGRSLRDSEPALAARLAEWSENCDQAGLLSLFPGDGAPEGLPSGAGREAPPV